MARTMRAHSPAFGSHSTFSTPHLGFWDHVQFLVRTERTAVTAAIVMFVGAYKDCDHHDVGSGSLRRRGGNGVLFFEQDGLVVADCPTPRFKQWIWSLPIEATFVTRSSTRLHGERWLLEERKARVIGM